MFGFYEISTNVIYAPALHAAHPVFAADADHPTQIPNVWVFPVVAGRAALATHAPYTTVLRTGRRTQPP